MASFMFRPPYRRVESLLYPFGRRMGGPQSRSFRDGEGKIRAPAGDEIPVVQSVAQSLY
jgi:hypothetical protein